MRVLDPETDATPSFLTSDSNIPSPVLKLRLSPPQMSVVQAESFLRGKTLDDEARYGIRVDTRFT